MRKKIYYLLILLISIGFTACNDKENVLENIENSPVSFHTTITEDISTRAHGTSWDNGDKIGVFAIETGTSLDATTIIDNYENLLYSTTDNGIFRANSIAINYPTDNSAMDFISYYPYKDNLTNYEYPINITDQLDFLYSTNVKNATDDGTVKTLQFQRMLSKVIFNVKPKNEGSLENLEILLKGAKTKAIFSLKNGTLKIDDTSVQEFSLPTKGNATQKTIEGIVLPTSESNVISVIFKNGSENIYTWKIPHKLEKGKVYTYTIELDKLSTTISRPKDYMEIPLYTASENAPNSFRTTHMVENKSWYNSSYSSSNITRNYSILYDTKNHLPYWVAYPMHPMYMGNTQRTDAWDYDPNISYSDQPNLSKSWMHLNPGNYNRGHLLPSSARNSTSSMNRPTFYYSNMVPQDADANSNQWGSLEQRVQYWAKQSSYDTLYVVTGVILPNSIKYVKDKNGFKSAIPEFTYKALLRKNKNTGKYYSIGFKVGNESSAATYRNSVVSVKQLEQETGFTFFPNLSKISGIDAESVKQQTDMSTWN